MARTFNGTADEIRCAVSTPANVAFGTYAAIIRKNGGDGSNTNFLRQVSSALANLGGLFLVGNALSSQWNALTSPTTAINVLVADGWQLVVSGKTTGNTTPRFYRYLYGTDVGTFANASASSTNGTAPATSGTYRLGSRDGGPYWNGDILVAGVWDRLLTDPEMENLRFNLMGWLSSNPVALWLLDQSLTTQVVGDLTGNGGNETTKTGTAIATNHPPVWNRTNGVWRVSHQQPAVTLLTGLTAYWKLDEASGTRADELGTSPLTDVNTVTQLASGRINAAAEFTAANSESLSRADDAVIGTGDIDFTFNFWLQWKTAPGTGFPIPISKDNASSAGDYGIYWDGGVGFFKWEVFGGVGRGACGSVYASMATGSTGVWYMITIDHSVTLNNIGIRVNGGARAASGARSGPAGRSSQPFLISGRAGGLFLDAYVDEVGFWKRSLTDAEALQLYNGGAGLAYPFTPAPPATSKPFYNTTYRRRAAA